MSDPLREQLVGAAAGAVVALLLELVREGLADDRALTFAGERYPELKPELDRLAERRYEDARARARQAIDDDPTR